LIKVSAQKHLAAEIAKESRRGRRENQREYRRQVGFRLRAVGSLYNLAA